MPMWEIDFSVNGRRSKTVIGAYSFSDAKKILEAQYAGCKITIWFWKRI